MYKVSTFVADARGVDGVMNYKMDVEFSKGYRQV